MEKDKKSTSSDLGELIKKVKDIPVLLVVGTLIQVYDKNKNPLDEKDLEVLDDGNYLALCPFHTDRDLGSFVITPERGRWYCFAEGFGGDGIDFEMKFFDIGFKESVYHLARRFGFITEAEYKKHVSSVKIDSGSIRTVGKTARKKAPKKPTHRAPDNVCNTVYSVFPRIFFLSGKHKQHLIKERGLKEDRLGDYFSFPSSRIDAAHLVIKEVARLMAKKKWGVDSLNGLSKEQILWLEKESKAIKQLREELPYVPGFYIDTKKNRIEFFSPKRGGIGFVVRDDTGKAVGINIRRDKPAEGESRYVWFSSAFAQTKQGCVAGYSSGAPGGVLFPETVTEDTGLCITEGRFKAEKIAEKGNIAIYVSGVSNWKTIMPYVDRLKSRLQGQKKGKLFAMFDADMMGNTAVHAQLKKMCEEAEKNHGMKPFVITWPKQEGKGFDDLVIRRRESYTKNLHCLAFGKFEREWEKALEETFSELGVKRVEEVPDDKKTWFIETLQKKVEKRVENISKKGDGKKL